MQNASIQVADTLPIVNIRTKDQIKFWRKVNRQGDNDCWLWLGYKDRDGYGGVSILKKSYRSHRVAFVLSGGVIQNGQLLLHRCDNPPCCNPNHLFPGTAKQNADDAKSKGRQARGDNTTYRLYPELKPFGERNGRAVLTTELVSQIRAQYVPRVVSVTVLARRFNVGRTTIFHILKGDTWGTGE